MRDALLAGLMFVWTTAVVIGFVMSCYFVTVEQRVGMW
jgi:hypothetical protein